jgi:hypothetical protein
MANQEKITFENYKTALSNRGWPKDYIEIIINHLKGSPIPEGFPLEMPSKATLDACVIADRHVPVWPQNPNDTSWDIEDSDTDL